MSHAKSKAIKSKIDKNKGLDYSKKHIADALGRPDLKKVIDKYTKK